METKKNPPSQATRRVNNDLCTARSSLAAEYDKSGGSAFEVPQDHSRAEADFSPRGSFSSSNSYSCSDELRGVYQLFGYDFLQLFKRFIEGCISDVLPMQWERRAGTFEDARPRPGDYIGRATPKELKERDERLARLAAGCRVHAAILRGDDPLGLFCRDDSYLYAYGITAAESPAELMEVA